MLKTILTFLKKDKVTEIDSNISLGEDTQIENIENNSIQKNGVIKIGKSDVGIIKWFRKENKYGFIQTEVGEVFFHQSAFLGKLISNIKENELVLFVYGENEKGLIATKIRYLHKNMKSLKYFDIFLEENPSFIMKCNYFESFMTYYITEKYENLYNELENVFRYKHPSVMYDPEEINKIMDKDDYNLSSIWIDSSYTNNQYERAKMISARAAEQVTKIFYTELCFEVKDISITQLYNSSKEWKSYDLLINNKVAIDVKNTRGSLNADLTYSEFIIPKFKKDRYRKDILIVGVLSPYLKLNRDNKLDVWYVVKKDIPNHNITVLGETTASKIESLVNVFSNGNLSLNINSKTLIPDWIFDYNLSFYTELKENKKSFITNIQKFDINIKQAYLMNGMASIFLSVGLEYPLNLQSYLNQYQLEFYNRILPKCKKDITRPYLYLAVLKYSLEKLSIKKNTFSPIMLKKIIYHNDNEIYPLGLYDPTKTIMRLISALVILYEYSHKIDTTNMILFKYTEKGILSGKNKIDGKWYTLFAYCGGFIDTKGYCGYQPLVRGKHHNCSICGKLICPKCSFCSDQCSVK